MDYIGEHLLPGQLGHFFIVTFVGGFADSDICLLQIHGFKSWR